jgi:hypothetical protein
MAPRLEELRPPVARRTERAATTGVRPPRRGQAAPACDDRDRRQPAKPSIPEHPPPRPSIPESRPPPLVDRGVILLVVFTASALTIVSLVVLVAVIGSWWTLIPVMAVDLALTAAVLVTVAKLLEDSDA